MYKRSKNKQISNGRSKLRKLNNNDKKIEKYEISGGFKGNTNNDKMDLDDNHDEIDLNELDELDELDNRHDRHDENKMDLEIMSGGATLENIKSQLTALTDANEDQKKTILLALYENFKTYSSQKTEGTPEKNIISAFKEFEREPNYNIFIKYLKTIDDSIIDEEIKKVVDEIDPHLLLKPSPAST